MNAIARRFAILSALITAPGLASAATITWDGTGGPANLDWSDTVNWTGGVLPGPNDTAYFDTLGVSAGAGAANADNIVNQNTTVAALWYAETNTAAYSAPGQWHNTVINPGVTLTVANTNVSIMLDSGTQTDPSSGLAYCYNTISGGGALVVTNTNSASVIVVSQGSDTYAGDSQQWAVLDMSGLNTFDATVGRLLVAIQGATTVTNTQATLANHGRQTGIASLAATNVITLTQTGNIQGTGRAAGGGPALVLDDVQGSFSDFQCFLNLGEKNTIYADTITIGRDQSYHTSVLQFNTTDFPTGSSLLLRGASSSRVSEFVVADYTYWGNTPCCINAGTPPEDMPPVAPFTNIITGIKVGCAGVVDLTGGSSDIMIDSLIVGKGYNGSGGGFTAGLFKMGAGTLNVNTLQLGALSSAAGTVPVIGTLDVTNGGTVVVNSDLALGQAFGGGTSANTYGTLNINGGTVMANAISTSGGTSAILDAGGSLIVTNPIAGLNTLSLDSSTANGQSSVTLNFSGGPMIVNALTADGNAADHIVLSVNGLAPIPIFPASVTLIEAKALTLTHGTFNFTLGTLPAGYSGGTLVQNGNFIVLNLTGGPAAGSYWSGVDAMNIDNLNWSDANNWVGNILPNPSGIAFFDDDGTSGSEGTPDNIVDHNVTISALIYGQTNGAWHNTEINSGVTLTVSSTNAQIALESGTDSDPIAPEQGGGATAQGYAVCYNSITGAGTLIVSNPNPGSIAYISQGSGAYVGTHAQWGELDMSGLSTFEGTFGRLLMAVQGVAPAPAGTIPLINSGRQTAEVWLAQTNSLQLTQPGNIQGNTVSALATAGGPALVLGDSGYGDIASHFNLGQSNAFWADTITIGRFDSLNTTVMQFNQSPTWSGPQQFYLRGYSSNRVSEFVVGDGTQTGDSSGYEGLDARIADTPAIAGAGNYATHTTPNPAIANSGLVDLTDGTSDIMIDTLVVAHGGPAFGFYASQFMMGAGNLNVNTVNLGVANANEVTNVTGILIVTNGGNVVVNNVLNLGVAAGGATANMAAGYVNILGGSLSANSIVTDGNVNSQITVSGGTLGVTSPNAVIGTSTAPLGSFTEGDCTLNLSLPGVNGSIVADNVIDTSTNSGIIINITSISEVAGLQPVVTLIQSATPIQYTGTVTSGANGTDFTLGTLPAGYSGHLQVPTGGNAVYLVLTAGPYLPNNWVGAGIPSHNTNWSDTVNWGLGVVPGPANGPAYFVTTASVGSSALSSVGGGPGALQFSKVNNIVDLNDSIIGLTYENTNGTFQNTYISNGITLTLLTNGLGLTAGSGALADLGNTVNNATISGPGALAVNSGLSVGLADNGAGSTPKATLDMSGLATLTANVPDVLVGVFYTVNQPAGVLYLAQDNTITATSPQTDTSDSSPVGLEVGDTPTLGSSIGSALYLGQSNTINAAAIAVGRQFANGGVYFNPAVTNSSPTINSGPWAYISGAGGAGTPVASWTIGDGVANPGTPNASGTNDFSGGYVNALVNALTVGNSSSGSSTVSAVNGTLTFNAGNIDASSVNVSLNNTYSDGNVYNYAVGTLNVNGTALLIVNGYLSLAYNAAAAGSGTIQGSTPPSGTLNINGASAAVWANSIVAGSNPNGTPIPISIINVNGGRLTATNGVATHAAPLTALNLTNSTISEGSIAAPFINARSVSVGGASNTINIIALPPIEQYPATVTVLQSATAIAGTYNFTVVLPAGYTGTAVESSDHTAIVLTVNSGPVGFRGNVYWNGPDGNNINWSDAFNWSLPGTPGIIGTGGTNDTAFFDDTGTSLLEIVGGTADNIVDENLTVAQLWYGQTNGNWHNTVINQGVTLTVASTNIEDVVLSATESDPPNPPGGAGNIHCYNTISGPGELAVNDPNPGSMIFVEEGSGTYDGFHGQWAVLDMSGLNTFDATVGRILVACSGVGPTPGQPNNFANQRATAGVWLAATNSIVLTQPGNIQNSAGFAAAAGPALVISDSTGSFPDSGSGLFLGQSNALWADSITIGRRESYHGGLMQFNPAMAGPFSFYLRGYSANRVSEVILGDAYASGEGNSGNGSVNNGTGPFTYQNIQSLPAFAGQPDFGGCGILDLSAGTSDMMVDTIIVGNSHNGAGNGFVESLFNMGLGTLNVNTLTLGQMVNAAANVDCSGIVNITGGTVIVNNQLNLGWAAGGAATTYGFGTVTVTGGTLSAAAIATSASPGNSSITVTGPAATLSLTSPAGTIGTAAFPIGSITLSGGTTLNLAVGGYPAVVTSSLTGSGTTDTINVTELPLIVGALPQTNTLIQTLSPISTYDFVLGPLPSGYTGSIVQSADSTSVLLVINTAPSAKKGVTITSAKLQAGSLVLTGTNGLANDEFIVLTSTNLAVEPVSNRWTPIATNTFDGNGNLNISLPYSVTQPGQYYRIKSQ